MASFPICVADLEAYASMTLPKDLYDFFAGGAEREQTLRDNYSAYEKYRLRPRYFKDLSKMDLSTQILGNRISMPICIAPTNVRPAHPDGAMATARAAKTMETIMVLSQISFPDLETFSNDIQPERTWLQFYLMKDQSKNIQLIKRAEECGFSALVLTIDNTGTRKRYRDLRNRFLSPTQKENINVSNGQDTEIKSKNGNAKFGESFIETVKMSFDVVDMDITWQKIDRLQSLTSLPIILKGILTAEGAQQAVDHGIKAVIVSNHGGRQLDGVPATIDVLSDIVKAVSGRCEVYMDGGIRTGSDVFKALALGAKAVFLGRPTIWGLTYDGEKGVKRVLEILKEELYTTMRLCGCANLAEITPDFLMLPLNELAKL